MIKLHIENGNPVAEISVLSFSDFANTMLELYESHEVIVNDMTHIDHVHLSYDTRGWSSLYFTIHVSNYYYNKPVETFHVYFGFVECDDEADYDGLHDAVDRYADIINTARPNTAEMDNAIRGFVDEINCYYGDC